MADRKIALVTGASRGIGRAIARRYVSLGYHVIAGGRDEAALQTLVNELGSAQIFPLAFDVSSESAIDRAVETIQAHFPKLDMLVNAAGISGRMPTESPDAVAHWNRILAVNLTGAFLLTRSVLPLLPNGGRIVMLSSVMGKVGVPAYAAYCASKHGVIGLVRSLALELAPRRITVNALCPGWVDTAMADHAMSEIGDYLNLPAEAIKEDEALAVPLGRFLRADEVAGLAAYLVSDEACMLTGQALTICGGSAIH
jgi:NAD(P)-dependent dehydrogenase (short-subunit alcohol dehydrogenase family)